METTSIHLKKEIADKAPIYVASKGKSLSSIIEEYLTRLTFNEKKSELDLEEVVPDIILSLLGVGAPLDEDDINGRKAYYAYLEKKYNFNVKGDAHHASTTDL